MSSRKILILAIALPTLGMAVYAVRYSGKQCGGEKANTNPKEYQCPRLYECVLESNKPNALGVCRFLPSGIKFWAQPIKGNEVIPEPPIKDPQVEYNLKTQKAQRLAYAQSKFGFEVLKELVYSSQSSPQNILISPVSMGINFSALYNGASGQTKDQLVNVLQIPGYSPNEINESAKILIDRLSTPNSGISSNISGSIWVKKGLELNQDFTRSVQTNYGVYLTNVDFLDTQISKTINGWFVEKTAGNIQDAVPEDIDPETVSYLVNSANFYGTWKYKFDSDKIETRNFYRQDGSTNPIPSMKTEHSGFLYFENNLFQAVKLPYGPDERYSMLVLLPKDLGISNLVANFDIVNWQNWTTSFKKRNGTLYLPKFEIRYGGSMTDALKSLDLVLPFDEGGADFSKMSVDGISKSFYINNVFHKTFVSVTEEGTETPPAIPTPTPTPRTKKVGSTPRPEELPFTMDVNKPFFFAIVHEETQSNLLVGIVRIL